VARKRAISAPAFAGGLRARRKMRCHRNDASGRPTFRRSQKAPEEPPIAGSLREPLLLDSRRLLHHHRAQAICQLPCFAADAV